MRVIFYIILFTVILFGSFIVDAPTMVVLVTAYLIGISITSLFNKTHKKNTLKIYSILFLASTIYMLACYIYMEYHSFDYLLAWDTFDVFLPMNKYYLSQGDYKEIISSIWENYQLVNRKMTGYYTYTALWGLLAKGVGANLYVTLQISTLFLYSFIGTLVYRLLIKCNFSIKSALTYSLTISICSIAFFYAIQIVRDIHVALLYLIAIYLTFENKFSLSTLAKLVTVIIITSLFRIESGLFLIIMLPTYLFLTLQNSKYKLVVLSTFVVLTIFIGSYYLKNKTIINEIYIANREHYIESDKGGGITGTLSKIPIIGDFSLIIFNALLPIPFTVRLDASNPTTVFGAPVDNIMRLPQSIAAVFNWYVIFYLSLAVISKSIRSKIFGRISKALKYNLWIGLLFFLLQSSVISQRRLIPFYIVYYILFFILYSGLTLNQRKSINIFALAGFFVLQIIGVLYLS